MNVLGMGDLQPLSLHFRCDHPLVIPNLLRAPHLRDHPLMAADSGSDFTTSKASQPTFSVISMTVDG